ncbi:MAG: hypothetical protein HQL67_08835 [Magnetococcales bacterium]|nr:hypothetical protein [Magnetococcales bacterium]
MPMFKNIFGRMALIFSPFIFFPVLGLAEEPVSVGQSLPPPSQLAGEGLLIPLSGRDPRSLIPLADQRPAPLADGVLGVTSYGGPPLTPPSDGGAGELSQSEPSLTSPGWSQKPSLESEVPNKTENRFWAPPQGFADAEAESVKEPTDTVKPPNLSSQIWSAEPPSEAYWRLGDDGPQMSKGQDDRFDFSEPEDTKSALPSYPVAPVLGLIKDRFQGESRLDGLEADPHRESERWYGIDGLPNTPAIPGYRTGDRSQTEEGAYAPYRPGYNGLDTQQSGFPIEPDGDAFGRERLSRGEPAPFSRHLSDGDDDLLSGEGAFRRSPYDPGVESSVPPLPDPWRLPVPTEFDQSDQPPSKRPVWSDEGTEYIRPPSKEYDPFDYGDEGEPVESHPSTRPHSVYDAPYGILEAPPEGTYGNQWR